MATALNIFIAQLRKGLDGDRRAPLPDVDEKDLGDGRDVAEEEDLRRGAVLSGLVEAGSGESTPKESELVYLHYAIFDSAGEVVWSTRSEHEGSGCPEPFILCKDARLPRGLHLAIQNMRRGERNLYTIKPEYAFKHPDFSGFTPSGVDTSQPAKFDVQLLEWFPKVGARALGAEKSIYKRILVEGQGWETPREPFQVTFHCEVRTPSTSGKESQSEPLCSSLDKDPIVSYISSSELPSGLDMALQSMLMGEKASFSVPRELLLPSAAIAFQADKSLTRLDVWVHLLDFSQVRDVSGGGGVMKTIVKKGEGDFPMDCPIEDCHVKVHWRVRKANSQAWLYDTRSEQEEPVTFTTGMEMVPDAIDLTVRLMLRGEVASARSRWKYSFEQARGNVPEGLEAGDETVFEVELIDFESERYHGELAPGEQMDLAEKRKEEGNVLYKQSKMKSAKAKYYKALKLLDRSLVCETEEEEQRALNLKSACQINLSLCASKEQEYGEVIHWTSKVIDDNPRHAKAYFRRAGACSLLGDFAGADEDLNQAVALDPSLAEEVSRERTRSAQRRKADEDKAKRSFANFFDRK